jgi:serine/threonine protein kinase
VYCRKFEDFVSQMILVQEIFFKIVPICCLSYMSPEQHKKVGHGRATDWWSFGVLVYQMSTNRYPFHRREQLNLDKLYAAAYRLPYRMDPNLKSLIKVILSQGFISPPFTSLLTAKNP